MAGVQYKQASFKLQARTAASDLRASRAKLKLPRPRKGGGACLPFLKEGRAAPPSCCQGASLLAAAAAMARRVPRLLCADLGRGWLASHHWTPAELAACAAFRNAPTGLALAALPQPEAAGVGHLAVKRSRSRFFMYEEHRADSHAKLQDAIGATKVLGLTPQEFFGRLLEEPDSENEFHYWTSPLSDVAPELLERLPGWEGLHRLADAGGGGSGGGAPAAMELPTDPRGPSLWVGSGGSATQAHYDVADNVIVQLHGEKRVRCYPPSAHEALHVFPDAHPRARKSQVNWDAEPADSGYRYPGFAQLGEPFLDVTLQPGDALSVPAFWFHHLENGADSGVGETGFRGPSVSLNLFALSAPMMASQTIFREGRPLEGDGGGGVATVGGVSANLASSAFAVVVLRKLATGLVDGLRRQQLLSHWDDGRSAEVEAQAFVGRLLSSRYDPLLAAAGVAGDGDGVGDGGGGAGTLSVALSAEEEAAVAACLGRLLPFFEGLRASCEGGQPGGGDERAVVELVAMHLLELWATALRGAAGVEPTLRRAFDV